MSKSKTLQIERAKQFYALHTKEDPLVLYNIWDAVTTKAVDQAGGLAIATGSWSIAASQGYEDGQNIPFEFMKQIIERIVSQTNLPVTADFEGGYATSINELKANFLSLINAGVVGINFEDQIIGSDSLYTLKAQNERITALREVADDVGVPIFINARTDLFLKEPDMNKHADLLSEALERGASYIENGANGFFVPKLENETLIRSVCNELNAPVNVMANMNFVDSQRYKRFGVSRVSYGPRPFFEALTSFEANAHKALN